MILASESRVQSRQAVGIMNYWEKCASLLLRLGEMC